MALYMGPSSNFGYGDSGLQGGQPPRATWGPQPLNGGGQSKTVSTAPPPAGALPPGVKVDPNNPYGNLHGFSGNPPPINAPPPMSAPPNTLASQAIRASGPSQSYDPNYLQNMASSIGSLFSNPGTGTQNINPLGDLSEISPQSGLEGNAPAKGLPQTWLQKALGGGGFSFTPPAPSVTPTAPKVGPTPVGSGRGGGGRYPL